MFGVINKESTLFLYPDLSSAISFFFKINKDDVSIEPNVNHALSLLSKQNNLYQVCLKELDSLPCTILNIGIFRNDDCECSLHSILLNIEEKDIESFTQTFYLKRITI